MAPGGEQRAFTMALLGTQPEQTSARQQIVNRLVSPTRCTWATFNCSKYRTLPLIDAPFIVCAVVNLTAPTSSWRKHDTHGAANSGFVLFGTYCIAFLHQAGLHAGRVFPLPQTRSLFARDVCKDYLETTLRARFTRDASSKISK